jgi:sulfhydrogenase subunit beta (sulfur reductase)
MLSDASEPRLLAANDLQQLIDVLRRRGYQVIGPVIDQQAVVLDEIESVAQLPAGWHDEHDGGVYRLVPGGDGAFFGHTVGPHSWKKYLHPPHRRLWRVRRDGAALALIPEENEEPPRLAFLGVRSCDLAAIAVQDRIFVEDHVINPSYRDRRAGAFIIAVNCGRAGGTCFCVSMGTGPKAGAGFDLVLTELVENGRHDFLVEAGSAAGAELLGELSCRIADPADRRLAAEAVANAVAQMGRTLDTDGVKELLQGNLQHPRWQEVADRCLTCGNCTLVCPTCFCTTVEDRSDLEGEMAERWLRWDSCFTLDFSQLGGGSVRRSAASRYRQWITHKLADWHDEFGTSGCVGCGRCIAWCPVGIDITEEADAIRATDRRQTHRRQP